MIERGYSAFSYADISEAFEIREAGIHHHFPTEAGLAVAALEAHRHGTMLSARATGTCEVFQASPMRR